MSDQVWVAVITVVIGGAITGAFAVLLRVIDRKAERAKSDITKSGEEVLAAKTALEGMEILLRNQRIDSDRKDKTIEDMGDKIKNLTKDLLEEKAINIALDRENAKLRRSKT